MQEIEITGVDLKEFAKAVYDLSRPQGLGMLHFTPTPLSDDEAASLVKPSGNGIRLSMDYVRGRSCKMHVREKDGKLFISNPWYDHTNGDLISLLQKFDIPFEPEGSHGPACECPDCKVARRHRN